MPSPEVGPAVYGKYYGVPAIAPQIAGYETAARAGGTSEVNVCDLSTGLTCPLVQGPDGQYWLIIGTNTPKGETVELNVRALCTDAGVSDVPSCTDKFIVNYKDLLKLPLPPSENQETVNEIFAGGFQDAPNLAYRLEPEKDPSGKTIYNVVLDSRYPSPDAPRINVVTFINLLKKDSAIIPSHTFGFADIPAGAVLFGVALVAGLYTMTRGMLHWSERLGTSHHEKKEALRTDPPKAEKFGKK